tara:strand:- start:177 stop:1019 length:843 start_codon:yes stop_codon:yes gene_type:complete
MLQFIIPTIAAVSGSLEMFLNKFILSREKVNYKLFTSVSFLLLSLIMLIISPFFFEFSSDFFLPINLILLVVIVIIGTIANVLLFHGMKAEKLTEIDALFVFGGFFTILLTALIYADERNPYILIPAVIASIALILSHVKKHHIKFHKTGLMVLGATLLFAFENVIVKYLLVTYNAFSLYFIRSFLIMLVLVIYFKPNLKKLNGKKYFHLTVTQVLIIVQLVLTYYSFQRFGVVYTMLIMTLMPILLYIYALVWLKEKLEWKKAVAGVVILVCVVVAQVL